jgi:hypothetical protein
MRMVGDLPTVLWVFLSLATVVSWQVGVESSAHVAAGSVVLAIGFIKLRLVGIHFMEIGNAPVALRALFETYCALTFAVLLTLFLVV